MAGYVACVFGASTELGRLVVRELLKRSEIDTVYALAVRDIKGVLGLSQRHMEKLMLFVKPLEKLLPVLREVPDLDLAFCCMGSSKAAYAAMGSVEFHRLNLEYPLRFVQAMFERDVMRIEILGHAKADRNARSDFARVKGEFEVAVRRLHRAAGPDGPSITLFKVPLLLTNERCQDGERGLKITKNELFRQRAAVRLGAGPAMAVHVRDIAKAMRVDALLNASAVDEGTGVDLLLLTKQIHFLEYSGPQIVEVASKTRQLESQERAAAREHQLNDFRMADVHPEDEELDAFDDRVPMHRAPHPQQPSRPAQPPRSPRRQRGTRLDPRDERQAYFEGADEDNPFLADSHSRLEYSNPYIQSDMEARETAGDGLSEAERRAVAAYTGRLHLRKDPGGAGSIERLKGQQKKALLTSRREDFYIPTPAGFGRQVGTTTRRTRMQGAATFHGGRVSGVEPPLQRTPVQRFVASPSMQSGRSGGSGAAQGRRANAANQQLSSPRLSERHSVPGSPLVPQQAQPGSRRSSMSRVQRRATDATAGHGGGSFGGSVGSARHSFSGSFLRRSSSVYSRGRRQSSARPPSEQQSGGWLSKITDRLLSPRKEAPAQGSPKRARRQNADQRDTGLIDI